MSDNKTTKQNIDEQNINETQVDNSATATNDTLNNDLENESAEDNVEEVDEIKKLELERDELKDQLLRKAAEFENYRKRTLKEKTELILNGGENVIKAILPILDDFERANDNMEKCEDIKTLKEGINLIVGKLSSVLTSQGLKKMDTLNSDFNTDFHEAIALIPATKDNQKGKIIDCTQAGYMLNEKVIRHAKVVVAQ